MKRVFLIGNGESRRDFPLQSLKQHGKIYMCNAAYRDNADLIDVLTAVDNGIVHEIYHSGFAYNKPCWFRNWTKVPAEMYETVVGGFVTSEDYNLVKDFDVIRENERGNAKEFVIHGTSIAGMASIIKNVKRTHPHATPDIVKKKIQSSQVFISWIHENDKSHDLREVWKDYKDHGWACGPSSGYIATKLEQPDEIYLIGHDLVSDTPFLNNMFKNTKHYGIEQNGAIPADNWISQWYTLMDWNPDVKFYKVNKGTDDKPTNRKLDRWKKWEEQGRLQYITQAQLIDKMSGM